jgi:hypothetical protein
VANAALCSDFHEAVKTQKLTIEPAYATTGRRWKPTVKDWQWKGMPQVKARHRPG